MLQYPNCRFPRTISGSVSDTHTNRVIFTHWPSLKQTWPWPMAPKNWVGLETIRLPFGASWAYFFSGGDVTVKLLVFSGGTIKCENPPNPLIPHPPRISVEKLGPHDTEKPSCEWRQLLQQNRRSKHGNPNGVEADNGICWWSCLFFWLIKCMLVSCWF